MPNNDNKFNIEDWYNKPPSPHFYKLRKKLIPLDISLADEIENASCSYCKGTGYCPRCYGSGMIDHNCGCHLCYETDDICPACQESGQCSACYGKGHYSQKD